MPKPYQVQDKYFLMAKAKGYRARSAFKLIDIQQKYRLVKKGQKVLDLGSAPGSFLQVLSRYVGPEGRVVGMDLQAIEPFDEAHVTAMQQDILETEAVMARLQALDIEKVDGVTSDLAPKTSGIKDLDQARSVELADQAFFLATKVLKPGGYLVAKVFEGEDLPWLLKRIKRKFKQVNVFKPPSCRDRSFERFIIARNFSR